MSVRFFVSQGRDVTGDRADDLYAQDRRLLADHVVQGRDFSLGPASNLLGGATDARIGLYDPKAGTFLTALTLGPPEQEQTPASGGYYVNATDFTGNATIFGGTWADLIFGGSGNDVLSGGEGRDSLIGGVGNDVLDGGAGKDRLLGGKGDDSYVVDASVDRVTETAGEGQDTITSSVDFALAAGCEVETLQVAASTGSQGLSLWGNEFGNTLIGNAGGNRLDGGKGADTLLGGQGNDVYLVDNWDDRALESAGGGTDVVYASADYCFVDGQEIEVLRANAGSKGLHLMGNEFAQTIIGGDGGDVLHGDGGADVLMGLGGRDLFAFVARVDAAPGTSRPLITDFKRGEDTIFLKTLQAIDGAATDQAFTWIGTSAFTEQAGQLHQVTYRKYTLIEGDTNGDGAADIQIMLKGVHALQASDFVL